MKDEDSGDPWLDQFLAGQARKEARANATGWGCAIAVILGIVIIAVLLSAH